MNEIKVNPLTLADMLAVEGKTLAQAKLINKSELQLYKEGICLIGKAFPAFGVGVAGNLLGGQSERKSAGNVPQTGSGYLYPNVQPYCDDD